MGRVPYADAGEQEYTPEHKPGHYSSGPDREFIRAHRESFDALKRRAALSLLLGSVGFFLLGMVAGAIFLQ